MSVIFLSGPIGAGKTAVARELLQLLPAPLSYIEGDTFWSFIRIRRRTRITGQLSRAGAVDDGGSHSVGVPGFES
jgi:uridine kinase